MDRPLSFPRRLPGRREGQQAYLSPRRCQRIAWVFLLLTALGCAAGREAARRDSEASRKLGIAFLTEGRPSLALREFSKADALTPDDPEIQYYLGISYWMQQRELGKAEEKLRRAVELKPDYADAWNDLGAFYVSQGRYREALDPLERAVGNVFYPRQELALSNLGWALFRLGRVEEAQERLEQAVETAPGFPLAHKFLGIVLQDRGRHEEALAELDQALRLLPEAQTGHRAEVQLHRGIGLLRLGRRAPAREAFEQAWRLAPRGDVGRSAKTYLDILE